MEQVVLYIKELRIMCKAYDFAYLAVPWCFIMLDKWLGLCI